MPSDWPTTGSSDWKNLSRTIGTHECSKKHVQNYKKWRELDSRLKLCVTVDAANQRILNEENMHWNNVLERIISIVHYLAKQNLAFRGNSSKFFEQENGNFLQLIETLAKFDPYLEEHIRRMTNDENKWRVNYLSHKIQNEMINILANQIKQKS